jgi:hypothetical protein
MATSLSDNTQYVSFDANSINSLIVQRLNQGQVFTDQNYQGSNLSAFIDIISYSFSTLLYYLNKTSSESLFSEAQIYENMNRIVKLLNYKPVGKLAQSVQYNISSNEALPNGNYVIPRYSSISVGGIQFSFPSDIYFTNSSSGVIQIQNNFSDLYLYEGIFNEYPTYTALGINNEVIYLNLGDTTFVDHFNIFVYVKDINTGKWSEWNQTQNLFLNKSTDKTYEIRYNPNKNYEIKFGDGINGKNLNTSDQVIIYYLLINPNASTIASNSLSGNKINFFNSINYGNILSDTLTEINYVVPNNQLNNIILNNTYPSNPYTQEESVDSIRNNASKNFSYQQRLVTISDFQNYINANYSNIFASSYVVNNDDYLSGHIKYLYDIGLNSPQIDNRVLYNQIKFANSCNFNNVYLYLVPNNNTQNYINSSQKEYIINELQDIKVLTSELVTVDPVYMNFDFYVNNDMPSINDINQTKLLIYKTPNTRKSSSGILSNVVDTITNYFTSSSVSLGQYFNINELTTNILSLDGVQSIKTYRSDTQTYINGISFLVWNSNYPNLDVNVYTQNLQLGYFQYPLFNNIINLSNRIEIVEQTGIIQVTDF